MFFLTMTVLTVVISCAGLEIALAFGVGILVTSFLSRWIRSTELRSMDSNSSMTTRGGAGKSAVSMNSRCWCHTGPGCIRALNGNGPSVSGIGLGRRSRSS